MLSSLKVSLSGPQIGLLREAMSSYRTYRGIFVAGDLKLADKGIEDVNESGIESLVNDLYQCNSGDVEIPVDIMPIVISSMDCYLKALTGVLPQVTFLSMMNIKTSLTNMLLFTFEHAALSHLDSLDSEQDNNQ